ncbi:MAG TPA: hypothetical protein VJ719_05870 [Chthoniobacterales bacterium]|nr:hypothetical protein [Chthoniobacterales bacterium]
MKRFFSVLIAVLSLFIAFQHASAVTIYGTAYGGGTGDAALYTIDPTTGTPTLIGLTGYDRVGGIDFNPLTGILYGTGTNQTTSQVDLITINTMTGMATTIGYTGLTTAGNPVPTFQDISFSSNGTLYGVSEGNLYSFNLATGAANFIGVTGLGKFGSGLAFDPSGTLYNINGADIGTINPATGAGTDTMTDVMYPLNLANPRTNAMDYDLTSGILYASVHHTGANFIAQIDPTTGDVSNARVTVDGLDGLAVFAPTPPPTNGNGVPEAFSTIWLALPLCGLLFVRRRYAS